MNLVSDGTVAEGALRWDQLSIPLPPHVREGVSAGQALILGIRPEAVQVVTPDGDPPPPDGIRLQGIVDVIEPDFARRRQVIYARTGEVSYAAVGPLDVSLNVGDKVVVVFPSDRLFFFDGTSERRL